MGRESKEREIEFTGLPSSIYSWLKKNIKVFVVGDELQNVYDAQCKNGQKIIGQLVAIGDCSFGVGF